ncbi:MAG: HAD family hydrolase [Hyphomicrobiales bacterium]|nr:HAD family hydrolase [Hyphomicrobiales bacterium]
MASRPNYELIIFDCDGVLVDSEVLSCHCLTNMLRQHEIEADLDFVFETFLGKSVSAVTNYYRAHGRTMREDFPVELRALVRHSFANSLQAIPDVANLLRGLDLSFCVASSSDLERIKFSLELTGLASLFAGKMFSAQMVRRGKPAPDLFLHAASSMGADPRHVLVIEDSVSGVEAGKAAGMTVWGFVGGSHYVRRDGAAMLKAAGAERVFARMSDFHLHRREAKHGRIR